jgi:hypothetical protein
VSNGEASGTIPQAQRVPNIILRGIRKEERGESQREFAEAMARAAWEMDVEVYPDAGYVQRLESGIVRWPHSTYRTILEKLCGRPALELGLAPSAFSPANTGRVNEKLRDAVWGSGMEPHELAHQVGVNPKTAERWIMPGRIPHPRHRYRASLILGIDESELWPETGTKKKIQAKSPASNDTAINPSGPKVSWTNTDTLDVDDVERRELLKLIGGAALSAPLSSRVDADALRRDLDSTINAPTTKSDVEEWERVTVQYSTESGAIPPALLLPELLTDLEEAHQRLKESPESLLSPMARVCGKLGGLAASNFFNSGDERSARRYWRTALRIINLTDDRMARVRLYAYRASFALAENPSSPVALAFAEDAINIANGIPCVGVATAHAVRTHALALLGDHRASERSLQELTNSFEQIPEAPVSARSDMAGSFSEQQLHFIEGCVYAHAGRVTEAAKALDSGRSMVPDGHWIAVTAFEAKRAICLVQAGDPSEGARHLVRSFAALPSEFRQVAMVRWAAEGALDAVPASAANLSAVVEARELVRIGA